MIIYHKKHVAAFVGNHTVIWLGQPVLSQVITISTAAAANNLIEQARSIARFTHTRVFGRVN